MKDIVKGDLSIISEGLKDMVKLWGEYFTGEHLIIEVTESGDIMVGEEGKEAYRIYYVNKSVKGKKWDGYWTWEAKQFTDWHWGKPVRANVPRTPVMEVIGLLFSLRMGRDLYDMDIQRTFKKVGGV